MGSIGQNFTFSEHGHVAYHKENQDCSNTVPKILPAYHPNPGDGFNRSKFNFFLEQGHVAYQIKGNHECTNMVANILPADPQYPHTLGMRAIGQNSSFAEYVMLHIIIYWNHKCSN